MGEILFANDIHAVKQAQVEANRLTEASGNEKRGAISDLQRAGQAIGNRRILDAAGKNINAITENIGRNLDASASGTFQSRIAAAEELGSNIAQAAAAGVGGSSVESYNDTLRLHQSIQEEQQGRATNTDNISASNSRGDTLVDAVGSMDNSVIRADLDFTQYVDHHKMGLFTRLATVGVAAAATVYGGPQAGMAVVGAAEAGQQVQNGDYAGASSSIMSSIQMGMNGFKAAHDTAFKGFWTSTKQANSSTRIP